jgi:hypothetical protein
MLRRLFSCDRIARQRSIRSSIPRNLLPDTKEYAITAVRPGGYAECNWLRGDLNLRTHSAREFCLTIRQSIYMIE